jgi:16S rRNA (guanine527-N7)-methyltransferase
MAVSGGPYDELRPVLEMIRARGPIGESVDEAIAHAERFIAAVPVETQTLVDLGSGGGVPGLVIAAARPAVAVTLVERRRTRADLLRRAVNALNLAAHTTVVEDDVRQMADAMPGRFDVATARSFGPPSTTLRWASRLVRPGGTVLIGEPPGIQDDRWPADLLAQCAVDDAGVDQGVRRFHRCFT